MKRFASLGTTPARTGGILRVHDPDITSRCEADCAGSTRWRARPHLRSSLSRTRLHL